MRGWAVGGVVVLATVVGMGGPALGNSDCVDMLDQKDVRSTMGDSWSADVRCGKTAAWDARGRTWVLGRQRWFVDDHAPANRTGLRVFPARMALASFFRSSNYGSHVVVKRRTFILSRNASPAPGEYAWSIHAKASGSLFTISSLPTRPTAMAMMRAQRAKLS